MTYTIRGVTMKRKVIALLGMILFCFLVILFTLYSAGIMEPPKINILASYIKARNEQAEQYELLRKQELKMKRLTDLTLLQLRDEFKSADVTWHFDNDKSFCVYDLQAPGFNEELVSAAKEGDRDCLTKWNVLTQRLTVVQRRIQWLFLNDNLDTTVVLNLRDSEKRNSSLLSIAHGIIGYDKVAGVDILADSKFYASPDALQAGNTDIDMSKAIMDAKRNSESAGETAADLSELRKKLEESYGLGRPRTFKQGDQTGSWRVSVVDTDTDVREYAADYAKAYMTSGDLHFIVNKKLGTTTVLRLYDRILAIKTTEYVDQEEQNARIIGEGQLLEEVAYDIMTGERFKADADPSAGSVTSDELLDEVRKAIDGTVGDGEYIREVSFDGEDLTITVDLDEVEPDTGTVRDLALVRVSSITDEILDLDDSYLNTWDRVIVDFGSVGKIVLDKDLIRNNGFGKYFDFTDDMLK